MSTVPSTVGRAAVFGSAGRPGSHGRRLIVGEFDVAGEEVFFSSADRPALRAVPAAPPLARSGARRADPKGSVRCEGVRGAKSQICAIGSNTDKLMKLADEFKIPAVKCELLNVAVGEIDKNFKFDGAAKTSANDGNLDEIALLSPAAASLDQFSGYVERGDEFKKAILNLQI